MKRRHLHWITAVLLGIYAAVILWLTILSRAPVKERITYIRLFSFFPTLWNDIRNGRFHSNFLGNILLFIPVGVLLPLMSRKRKLWKAVLAGGCFSLVIETIQFIAKKGVFDLDDILLNVFGTWIGYMLFMVGAYLIRAVRARRKSDTRKKTEEKTA